MVKESVGVEEGEDDDEVVDEDDEEGVGLDWKMDSVDGPSLGFRLGRKDG